MQDLVKSITEKVGLTPDQAVSTIGLVKEFVKSKLPVALQGQVDGFFNDPNFKLSSQEPGALASAGEKADEFLDVAKDKAEDLLEVAKDKTAGLVSDVKNFFGGDNK